MNEREKLAEKLARAALEGFFGCTGGFEDMSARIRKNATKKVLEKLEAEIEKLRAF